MCFLADESGKPEGLLFAVSVIITPLVEMAYEQKAALITDKFPRIQFRGKARSESLENMTEE